MTTPKFTARIGNIYFLDRIGCSLRWATSDITREELPPDIHRLLRRLERLDARDAAKAQKDGNER